MLLEPIFEADFHDCSHGFRQGRSTTTALRDVVCSYSGISWMGLPLSLNLTWDYRVAGFALALTLLTVVVVGLVVADGDRVRPGSGAGGFAA
jgi:hypothetical protein